MARGSSAYDVVAVVVCDVADADAVAERDPGVAELMQEDRAEEQQGAGDGEGVGLE